MISTDYGAAEEKKKKEQEAQDFASRMNAKYNRSDTDKAMDEYDRQHGNPKTQLPSGEKHLASSSERVKTAVKKTASKLVSKTHSYLSKKIAERKAYLKSPAYKKKLKEREEKKAKRKEEFKKKMAASRSKQPPMSLMGGLGGGMFGPQQPSRKSQKQPQNAGIFGNDNSWMNLGFSQPQKTSNKQKKGKRKRKPPVNGYSIVDAMPRIF